MTIEQVKQVSEALESLRANIEKSFEEAEEKIRSIAVE